LAKARVTGDLPTAGAARSRRMRGAPLGELSARWHPCALAGSRARQRGTLRVYRGPSDSGPELR